jgi:hypothetical protein
VVDGQATLVRLLLLLESIVTGAGDPGDAGSNVTSPPLSSTVVHCVADRQAIAYPPWLSIIT